MKNNSKKIIKVCLITLFFISLMILHYYIDMYGDDFWYYSYTKNGVINSIKESAKLYMTTNGRLVPNILISYILNFDIKIWKFINSILICVLVLALNKLIKFKKREILNIFLIIMMFIGMDTLISQESIYWLTGAFNYIYPFTFLIVNFIFLLNCYNKEKKGKIQYLVYFTTFLTSFMVEQSAIANAILIFSLIFLECISKKKISKYLIVNLFMSIIGFLFIYFSPGCQNRIINEQTLNGINLIYNNMKLIINMLFFYRPFQIINIILSLFLVLVFLKAIENKYYRILVYLNTISTVGFTYIYYNSIINGYFDIINQALIIKIFCVFVILIHIYSIFFFSFDYYKKTKDKIPFIISGMTYISQIPMLFVPTMGFRTVLISYFGMIILVVYLINIYLNNISVKNNYQQKYILFIIVTIFLGIGLINYNKLYFNYRMNNFVLTENHKKIIKEKDNQFKNSKIILKKTPNVNYRWMLPYESEPHMDYFKQYYNIPDKIELVFE